MRNPNSHLHVPGNAEVMRPEELPARKVHPRLQEHEAVRVPVDEKAKLRVSLGWKELVQTWRDCWKLTHDS